MIPDWLRGLGWLAPDYANCCGKKLDCSESGNPLDPQDCACLEHDTNLFWASQQDEPLKSELKSEADKIFASQLRSDLRPWYQKIYGPVWNYAARLFFR